MGMQRVQTGDVVPLVAAVVALGREVVGSVIGSSVSGCTVSVVSVSVGLISVVVVINSVSAAVVSVVGSSVVVSSVSVTASVVVSTWRTSVEVVSGVVEAMGGFSTQKGHPQYCHGHRS